MHSQTHLHDWRGYSGLVESLQENCKIELRGERVVNVLRMFIENPGTGKTSVAKIYDRVENLGYHSKGDVVVEVTSKLTGSGCIEFGR